MAEGVVTDNDVVLKIATWRLADEFADTATLVGVPPALLGVGRYVVESRLERATNLNDVVGARAALTRLLGRMRTIEPTESELELAATIELQAVRASLQLDPGESQLLAVLLLRDAALMLTGDKRAIAAMAKVAPEAVRGRVACLEQLVAELLGTYALDLLRARICGEPAADRAVSICFSCRSSAPALAEVLAGLESYRNALVSGDTSVLLRAPDLGPVLRGS